jgi:multidrug efflux pump subunit AcrA (membrane-fusion protein)
MRFTTVDKAGDSMKKKLWKRIVTWSILAAVVIALAVLPAIARNRRSASSSAAVSCSAVKQEIITTLSGGGTLQPQDAVEVRIPDGVEITRFLVKNGSPVEAGQALAETDTLSVMAAVRRLQDSLETINGQISDLEKNAFVSLTSAADGRIKAVYARKDSDVRQVLLDHGALAVVSLDGLMCVRFPCEADLLPGTSVTVLCTDGKEYDGKISSSLRGTVEVTLTDDGPQMDEPAVILAPDGSELGSGMLQVHSPLRILYTDGTVQSVSLKEGQQIRKGSVLLRIRDAGGTKREQLSQKHREYEDLLQELLQIARSGEITAPCAGLISGIDETAASGLSSSPSSGIILLADGDPAETEPETPPVSSELLMVTSVDENGITLGKAAPVHLESEDMDILSMFTGLAQTLLLNAQEVPLDLSGARKLDGSAVEQIQSGDVFVRITFGEGEQTFSRLIYIGHTELASSFSFPSFQLPDFSAFFPAPKAEDDLFPLEGKLIASVTPQETMKILLAADELDILQYQKGMSAEVTLDALPGEVFAGTVTQIAAAGTNSGGSSKFTVTVELPCTSSMLAGMNASVDIRIRSSGPVLALPAAAVQDRGSANFVYTGFDSKADSLIDPVSITAGVSDGDWVEIISGLEEGQTVWYMTYTPVS